MDRLRTKLRRVMRFQENICHGTGDKKILCSASKMSFIVDRSQA